MISECIFNDIPPQMKILNIVIPILTHFCSFVSNGSVGSHRKPAGHPIKCDIINDFKQFPTVYHRRYCCKFLTFSNQMPHYKSKCIRIGFYQSPPVLTELLNIT